MTAATVMKFSTLPYEELELSGAGFVNPRPDTNPGLEPKSIAELADDILERGLEEPLRVWSAEVDRVVHHIVVRGQRRYLAIGKLIKDGKANGFTEKTPIIYVQAKTMAEAMISAIRDQAHGVPLSSAELAEYMLSLRTMGHTGADIAKALGKSPGWVSRILGAFETATPELREEWKKGAVTDENAKQLAKLPAPAQAEAVREHVELRAKGTREAKSTSRAVAKVKAASVTPPPKKKGGKPSAQVPIFQRRPAAEVDDLRDTLQRCDHAKVFGQGGPRMFLTGMLLGLRWTTGDLRALPSPVEQAIKRLHAIEAKKDAATKAKPKKAR